MEAISPPFARETARGNSLVPTRWPWPIRLM